MHAALYDGVTALRHTVAVEIVGDRLDVTAHDGARDEVPASLLVRHEREGDLLRLGRSDRPGWRMLIPLEWAEALDHLLPAEARYGRWIDRIGLWPAIGLFAVLAAIVLLVGHLAPQWIAPLIPQRWESDLGATLVGDFGDNRCASPDGNRALARLADRIEPGIGAPGERHITFTALDFGIFNAAALPGAQIVVFKGLLKETPEPDAVAGVLAHEIAHVRRRHVTQALIREIGIGSLIRLFAGGIGANTEQLVSLSYTRANEAQADADAIIMLRRAAIDPRPTARLFDKLALETGEGEHGGYGQFLQSHPVSRERAKRFATSYDPRIAYRPVLGSVDAAVLTAVCAKPTPAK
jgi:hypothetical protein